MTILSPPNLFMGERACQDLIERLKGRFSIDGFFRPGLKFGHLCPMYRHMKGKTFIDRVSELGMVRGVPVYLNTKRGKGSHVTLYYGSRKTVVKDRRKELPPGLLSAMIRQLGLDRSDFP